LNAKAIDVWSRIYSDLTTKAIFVASVLYMVFIASGGWDSNLLLMHSFRQTQTAITVSALLKGGPWLAYETPVLGPPWSIPFEFPLYQWIVALVVKTGWFHINQAGRLVSELFFFSALYPLFQILALLQISKKQRYIILAIFCISPQYLFWSQTFMIESAALALSIYFLWLTFLCREMIDSNRIDWLVLLSLSVVGSLAGLVKITTFFSFLGGAVVITAVFAFGKYRRDGFQRKKLQSLILVLTAIGLVPFLAVSVWTGYADSLKELNPLGKWLTSGTLQVWNFGTLDQKLSLKTWSIFYARTFSDLVGNSLLLVISIAMLFFCRKALAISALVSIGLYTLAVLTFTNLHYIHNYYAYANGIFLVVAVGIAITELFESPNNIKRVVGLLLFGMVIFFSVEHFKNQYMPIQNAHFDFTSIRGEINAYSKPEDVFIVIGDDWSSAVPYYINRRTAPIKEQLFTSPKFSESFSDLKKNLQKYHIGGIIFRTKYNVLPKGDREFINDAVRFFNIKPVSLSKQQWYDNSRLFIVYNGS